MLQVSYTGKGQNCRKESFPKAKHLDTFSLLVFVTLVSNPCVYQWEGAHHVWQADISTRLTAADIQVSIWIVIRTFVQVSWDQKETFVTTFFIFF